MRITKKKLIKLTQEALDRVEMPFEVTSIDRSRFRSHEYEGGAWHWKANIKHKTEGYDFELYSYLPFSEFEDRINEGYRLVIKCQPHKRGLVLDDYEITLSK